MAAVKPDYYEVLGVPHDADEETIRRAFDALARECHPDVSDDPEDNRRFRELAEAYGVLSRPASRLLYDRAGHRGHGENVHARLELRPTEAARGTTRLLRYDAPTLCAVCEGIGVIGEADPECRDCGGTGRVPDGSATSIARILRIETCPACGVESCDACDGSGLVEAERRLRVRIPGGIEHGTQVRVAEEGGDAGADGVAGDLLVDIAVAPAPGDSPAVRYLALAGALAAAVLLVAYLLLA